MNYLAILDYDHLDNALFLKAFAEALASQQETKGIILHGDSAYTERLIQTGMMRDEARRRSVKDLNHRLIALLADSGVAATGVNAYQRNIVVFDGTELEIDKNFLTEFPSGTHLVLSNLVLDQRNDNPLFFELPRLAESLHEKLALDEVFIFSGNDADEVFTSGTSGEEFTAASLPPDLKSVNCPCRLTSTQGFRRLPDITNTTMIR